MILALCSPEEAIKPVQSVTFPVDKDILEQMWKILEVNNGIGLAAPQVGYYQAFFIYKLGNERRVVCNPHITLRQASHNRRFAIGREGCLTLPGAHYCVARWVKIRMDAQDENGSHWFGFYNDLGARLMQHEVDHLKGFLIDGTNREKKEKDLASGI